MAVLVKPSPARRARCADDAPRKWRWAWKDTHSIFPFDEGSGGYRDLISGTLAYAENDGPLGLADSELGRGLNLPAIGSFNAYIDFRNLPDPVPIADASCLVVGGTVGGYYNAVWVGVKGSRSPWFFAAGGPSGGAVEITLLFQDAGGKVSPWFAKPYPHPTAVCWRPDGTGSFHRAPGDFSAFSGASTPSHTPTGGLLINSLEYSGSIGEGAGGVPNLLTAIRKYADPEWCRRLVADPFSWITRPKIFSMRTDTAAWAPTDEGTHYVAGFVANSAGTLQNVGGSPATANNDPVGEWKDQSGNANHLIQNQNNNQRPVLKTSGGPSGLGGYYISFDGGDDVLYFSSIILNGASAWTVGVITKTGTTAYATSSNSGDRAIITGYTGSGDFEYYGTSGTPRFTIKATPGAGFHSVAVGGDAGGMTSRCDNAAGGSTGTAINAGDLKYVGSPGGITSGPMDIAAVFVFDKYNTSLVANLEAYMYSLLSAGGGGTFTTYYYREHIARAS